MTESLPEQIVLGAETYTATVSEREYGWCWCTDGEHGYQHHKSVGWSPYWCGSRRNASAYRTACIGPEARSSMHLIQRRYVVLRANPEVAA